MTKKWNEPKGKKNIDMTLGEHAEIWWKKQGKKVPRRNTQAWNNMYRKWIKYAFRDFR